MSEGEVFGSGISRRGFLKWCSYLASRLALPAGLAPQLAAGLERQPRLPVIWLSLQSCSGCTESQLRSHAPTLEKLIFDYVSLEFHDVLQAATGEQAEHSRRQSMQSHFGRYLLITEGAVATRNQGSYGVCSGISHLEQLREAAEGAAAIMAVGSCAAFGGIPHAQPNPTGTQGVGWLMQSRKIPRRPLVNIPGCPPLPVAMTATLAHLVAFGEFPRLDALGRPLAFYGRSIHDHCPRLSFFQRGLFAEGFDDRGARRGWCLFKLGCKGPATRNACSLYKWGDGTSFPVESGHPCLGCSEPDFWDAEGFYHPLKRRIPIESA